MRKLIYLMLVLIPVLLWQFSSSAAQPTPIPVEAGANGVEAILDQLGISSGSLEIVEPRIVLDMTDLEDQFRWEDISFSGRNFALRALIRWGPGDSRDQCGFVFRNSILNNNFYTLQIDRAGGLEFHGRVGGQWWETPQNGSGDLILTEPDAVNELTLIAVGDQFTVYLNGQYADQFRDDTLRSGGTSVIGMAWNDPEPTSCTFRDVQFWSLDNETDLLPTPTTISLPELDTALALTGLTAQDGSLGDYVGVYTIDLTGEDDLARSKELTGHYTNFIMGTTFGWGPGDRIDQCGAQFRRVSGDDYYTIRLDQDGFAFFRALRNDDWEPYVNLDGSAIRTGADDLNTLVLVAIGPIFRLYINDIFAGEFTHDRLTEGEVRIMAVTFDNSDETHCTFHSSWVWGLSDEAEMPLMLPPTATPLPSDVQYALNQMEIASSSGYEAERIERTLINLTGEDNLYSWESFDNTYSDFVLGTTFTWGPGHIEDECGLVVRGSNTSGYLLLISQEQNRMYLQVTEDSRPRDFVYFDLPMLRGEEGSSNNLWIAAVGDTFVFYLNSLYIGQYQDSGMASGEIGLLASTGANSDITYCTFEDSWVWELAYDTPAIMTATPDFPSVMTVIPTWTPEPM